MQKLVLIGCGGFIGSIARYVMSGLVHRLTGSDTFPLGTLAVNLTGCFLIGALAGWDESRGILSEPTRIFLFIGLLGGFTTFSTFGFETCSLLRDGQLPASLGNALVHVVAGVGAVWVGLVVSRLM
jgi:CrcB protein